MNSKFKDFYESWAANNKKICFSSEITDFRIKNIIKIANEFNLKKILDVGCGYGYFARMLHNNGFDVTGVDISSTNINYSKENNPGPKYMVHDFESESAKEKYDLIYAFDVLEHVYDYDIFLKNCNSALNKGGFLFISTQNAYAPKRKFKFLFGLDTKLDFVSKHHIHFFGPQTLKNVLINNGFQEIKLIGSGKLSFMGIGFSGNMLAIGRKL